MDDKKQTTQFNEEENSSPKDRIHSEPNKTFKTTLNETKTSVSQEGENEKQIISKITPKIISDPEEVTVNLRGNNVEQIVKVITAVTKTNDDKINIHSKEQNDNNSPKTSKTNKNLRQSEDPGPSGNYAESKPSNLPGTVAQVHRNNLQKSAGLSKSEHSIRQLSNKDVVNALKLTSISYNNAKNQKPLQEVKIPVIADELEISSDATFVDLKSFMATCFKINKNVDTVVTTVPVKNVHAAISTVDMDALHAKEISNCLTSPAQTDGQVTIPNVNKVIINVGENGIDTKESKISDKSKPSGNVSERSEYGFGQRDSLSSIGSNVCRICMTRGRERLISPCNCKGSLANVHLTCLERWLNQVGRNHCELCGFSYPAIRTPRYTVLQALRLWFSNPRNRSHLQSDCLIFWLLSTVTAGLLAVCIVGNRYFGMEGNRIGKMDRYRKDAISHRITETAMDFFMGIVLCGYTITAYLLWKDHYIMWNRWRRANVNVRLLLAPDANPVPFVPRARYHVL